MYQPELGTYLFSKVSDDCQAHLRKCGFRESSFTWRGEFTNVEGRAEMKRLKDRREEFGRVPFSTDKVLANVQQTIMMHNPAIHVPWLTSDVLEMVNCVDSREPVDAGLRIAYAAEIMGLMRHTLKDSPITTGIWGSFKIDPWYPHGLRPPLRNEVIAILGTQMDIGLYVWKPELISTWIPAYLQAAVKAAGDRRLVVWVSRFLGKTEKWMTDNDFRRVVGFIRGWAPNAGICLHDGNKWDYGWCQEAWEAGITKTASLIHEFLGQHTGTEVTR